MSFGSVGHNFPLKYKYDLVGFMEGMLSTMHMYILSLGSSNKRRMTMRTNSSYYLEIENIYLYLM